MPKVSGMMAGNDLITRNAATKANTARIVAPPAQDSPKNILSPSRPVLPVFSSGVVVTLCSCDGMAGDSRDLACGNGIDTFVTFFTARVCYRRGTSGFFGSGLSVFGDHQ